MKCSLSGKLNPLHNDALWKEIDSLVEHTSKCNAKGWLVLNRFLLHKLDLDEPLPFLHNQRLHDQYMLTGVMSVRQPNKPIEELNELRIVFPKISGDATFFWF